MKVLIFIFLMIYTIFDIRTRFNDDNALDHLKSSTVYKGERVLGKPIIYYVELHSNDNYRNSSHPDCLYLLPDTVRL